jgi:FtsZ-interacting cell division protein ZipA
MTRLPSTEAGSGPAQTTKGANVPTWGWVLIAVAAVAAIALLAWSAYASRRRKRLQERFGSEYDHTVADAPSRREAESELSEREKRREELQIQPLDQASRDRYASEWHNTQARFVDDPEAAVDEADRLIQEVMRERGYPVDDFEQRTADLSVDHPEVMSNYRAAHGISVANQRGKASTEDLRTAMVHYRALFVELLEQEEPART